MSASIEKILLAGVTGQSILRAGRVLARAGMQAGYEVSWVPDTGPEGSCIGVVCTVILATGPIDSPLVSVPDAAIAFTAQAAQRLEPTIKAGGLLLEAHAQPQLETQAGVRDDVRKIRIPPQREVQTAGLDGFDWAFTLGAFSALSRLLKPEAMQTALELDGPALESALQAMKLGVEYVKTRRYMKERYALSIFTS